VTAREFQLTVDVDGARAIDVLAAATDLPRARLKDALNKGAVWLRSGGKEQRLRRATRTLRRGERIALYYDEDILLLAVPEPQLIADEKAYSLWRKPAGLLAQGTRFGDHCSLLRVCEKYFSPARDAFLVHRLDREAEGLMLIAHTRKAAELFSALWQERAIGKSYTVEVEGCAGAIGERRRVDAELDGKPAATEFTVAAFDAARNRSTLNVDLITGRKHQIRRHLAGIGLPVVGDYRYGSGGGQLALRAVSLRFRCPLTGLDKRFGCD
jgi:tRNA pseudouridine32 synthase/23S rRNA pseudouridine746 synthase